MTGEIFPWTKYKSADRDNTPVITLGHVTRFTTPTPQRLTPVITLGHVTRYTTPTPQRLTPVKVLGDTTLYSPDKLKILGDTPSRRMLRFVSCKSVVLKLFFIVW